MGQAVTQETNDKKQLLPMITTVTQQSGETPTQILADAGYCSDGSLTAVAALPVDAYVSTRKQKHGERPGPCPRGPLPKTATVVDRMTRKLHTKAGAAVYAARKAMVEPVFGQIKEARGFRRFLLRASTTMLRAPSTCRKSATAQLPSASDLRCRPNAVQDPRSSHSKSPSATTTFCACSISA